MGVSNVVPIMSELPADATCSDAAAWSQRIRQCLERWEELPGHECTGMTAEIRQQTLADLDTLDLTLRRDIKAATST